MAILPKTDAGIQQKYHGFSVEFTIFTEKNYKVSRKIRKTEFRDPVVCNA